MKRASMILAVLVSVTALSGLAAGAAGAYTLPPIRHVFVIVLENESASVTFGPTNPAPYLSQTMRAEGAYLPEYHATGHNSNDNYISMISGQAPNTENQLDCQIFDNFPTDATGAYGQQEGVGCVYPSDIPNIATQLDSAGLTWRDYNEDMGNDPTRESAECGHPGIGTKDGTQTEVSGDAYATRHDPFVYFHSIIDSTTLCDSHVVNLNLLSTDLQSASTTANYTFITPDLCGDGHDATCATPGRPGGFAGINNFLQTWVPKITSSPAYKQQNGLLIVTFDEASTSDTSSCCGEIAGPGTPEPGLTGPGGGDVGAVLMSPCIKPGTVSIVPYNHYSMLGSVEDIFGVPHIGYAQLPGEVDFGPDIFTGPCSPATPTVKLRAPKVIAGPALHPPIAVSWSSPSAGATFEVQVRRLLDGRRPTAWKTLLKATKRLHLSYRATRSQTYQFRVRATSTTGAVSAWQHVFVRVLHP